MCQESLKKPENETNFRHHDRCSSVQITFFNQVEALTNVIEEMGNPFIEESNELLVLDTRDVADPLVVDAVHKLKKTGLEQYNTLLLNILLNKQHQSMPQLKETSFLSLVIRRSQDQSTSCCLSRVIVH